MCLVRHRTGRRVGCPVLYSTFAAAMGRGGKGPIIKGKRVKIPDKIGSKKTVDLTFFRLYWSKMF
jgi:hypothetical protein